MAAEHNFLEWIDKKFIEITNSEEAWSAWLQLLRSIYNPSTQEVNESAESTNTLIDVEIFDDTDPNIFDEPIYTAYKCFCFMLKNMNKCTSLDETTKQNIIAEYSELKEL